MTGGRLLSWAAITVLCTRFSCAATTRELTFEDRVRAQRAIEQVYWSHRIWPAENARPKPPLSAVMPDEAIRAKVEDCLRKSNALETLWQRSVTAAQLQAEMDRMSRETRDGTVLQELFAALGNDPFVIAETLARKTLVDRLIQSWYGSDARFHEGLRRRAEESLARPVDVAGMRVMGGKYSELTLRLGAVGGQSRPPSAGRGAKVIELSPDELSGRLERLARLFGSSKEMIPTGQLSTLREDSDGFSVTAVLDRTDDSITIATVTWPKVPFDVWWDAEKGNHGLTAPSEPASFRLLAPSFTPCVQDTWQQTCNDCGLNPRAAHTAVWTGTEMIVWGGTPGGSTNYNTGWRYNPATDSWLATSRGANVPAARMYHSAVWTGTEMIVWGGRNVQTGSYLSSGGRYDPATDSWRRTSNGSSTPVGRQSHTAVWTGTEMIIWGGNIAYSLNTGGRYSPATDSWRPTATGMIDPPLARTGHTAVWTGTEMIVWGGGSNTGGRYFPATDTWWTTSTGTNVPSARTGHTAVWTGTEMIIWGGSSTNTGGRYRPANNSWLTTSTGTNVPHGTSGHMAVWTGTEMIVRGGSYAASARYNPATDSWVPASRGSDVLLYRAGGSAVWTGTEMIIWGGVSYNTYQNTGGRYNPVTDTWVTTNTETDLPHVRGSHTAVWTGAEMIVWGGNYTDGNTFYCNSGGQYDPATNIWAPTPIDANTPEGRQNHTAVWTGREMILWGGYAHGDVLNSGGRYDPATRAWRATSLGQNVPVPRYFHTAVWTGTEMIVWGGDSFSYWYENTGGRYDPAADSWRATSQGQNVPEPRTLHSAVWTGREMIVWGGTGVYPWEYDDGGRYDPSRDTWTPTSVGENLPEFRHGHTAIWTGTEMIIWGGRSWGDYYSLETGARYNPSTDTWASTSTGANAPTARRDFTTVWTGNEMIVWGGREYYGDCNTGGRYNPRTDTWVSTSAGADAPVARELHTAVWTGTEMIVWGGEKDYDAVNSGGRYCAASCINPTTFYADGDGDGYGNATISVQSCLPPQGYAAVAGDCDDTNGSIHPGASEECDGIDNDCDGTVDDIVEGKCEDGDPCTYNVCAGGACVASPVTVSEVNDSLRVVRDPIGASIAWTDAPGPFNVYRGSRTGALWTYDEKCLESGTYGPVVESELPSAGGVFYYLVTRRTACGESAPGRDSTGNPIPNQNSCP